MAEGPHTLTSLPVLGSIQLSNVSSLRMCEIPLLKQLFNTYTELCLFACFTCTIACKIVEAIKTQSHKTYLKNRDFKNAMVRVKEERLLPKSIQLVMGYGDTDVAQFQFQAHVHIPEGNIFMPCVKNHDQYFFTYVTLLVT